MNASYVKTQLIDDGAVQGETTQPLPVAVPSILNGGAVQGEQARPLPVAVPPIPELTNTSNDAIWRMSGKSNGRRHEEKVAKLRTNKAEQRNCACKTRPEL